MSLRKRGDDTKSRTVGHKMDGCQGVPSPGFSGGLHLGLTLQLAKLSLVHACSREFIHKGRWRWVGGWRPPALLTSVCLQRSDGTNIQEAESRRK